MRKNILVIIACLFLAVVIWVVISLGNKYQASLAFPVKVVDLPKGHSVGSLSSQTVTLTVYGKGWDILRYYLSSGHEFLISAARDTGFLAISVSRSEALNTWLTSSAEVRDMQPSVIQCFVQKTSYRYVRVVPAVKLSFPEGYGLASPVIVSPDSVLISGPPASISGVKEISTSVKELNNLTEETSLILPLRRQRDFELYPDKVTITLDIQKIVETELRDLQIVIRDVPPDRQVVVIPERINLTLRGGLNMLAGITQAEVSVFRNYRDLLADSTGTLAPEVHVPPNTALVGTNPQNFKFIIKKF